MFNQDVTPASIKAAKPAATLAAELSLTARLGAPLGLGELGWMSTYIVDALMIGQMPHSALSISASSLGNTIFYALAFCSIGLLTGIETLVAQAYGRGDAIASIRTLAQSFWFVVVSTPIVMLATLASVPLLRFFGTPAEIVDETQRYVNALVWSTAPLLLYWALRRYLQSIDRAVLIMVSLLTAGAVNFAADWAFIYGHLGLHSLGVAGSGWATCVVRVYALILLFISLWLSNKDNRNAINFAILRPNPNLIRALLKIGWPEAIRSLGDLSTSTFLSILCARLGATLLAAHQVVLDLNAIVYMVPLGLSYATATRVGQSAGRKNIGQVRRAAQASLYLGLGFIVIAGSLFVAFPRFWASLYTNDALAVTAAVPIFLLCGFIQLGDTTAVIFMADLVGIGDTRTPLIANVFWSWLIGMPVAYLLTFRMGWGLQGLWTGRVVAALGTGITLAIAWNYRLRKNKESIFLNVNPTLTASAAS